MNMKFKALLISALAITVLAGCGANNRDTANEEAANDATNASSPAAPAEPAAEPVAEDPNAPALVEALGENGTWVVTLTQDVTVANELIVVGAFHQEGDPANPLARKLQLSELGADGTATTAHTLTVPKLSVQSENFVLEGGTVKGDIYVEASGFYLDASTTVDGSIHFPNQEMKLTAQIYGKVTGLVR
ncbi:hypothetical protein MO973_11355 [Paenibacillus sp. TRM 82003]|nr:hypothetical protein [Paenibacillus sp. TRM 82003]